MGARRMTFADLADKVPDDARVEVWGDSSVWLLSAAYRIRLREFVDADCPPPGDWPTVGAPQLRFDAGVDSVVAATAAALIHHQRTDIAGCLCGWAELGKSFAEHQARIALGAAFAALGNSVAP